MNVELTENEVYLISDVFQDHYCMSIEEMAKEDSRIKELFTKLGLLEDE